MKRVAHVWPEPPRAVKDSVEVAAEVEWPWRIKRFWRGRRQRVWIRVPGHVQVPDQAASDAMLLGTVFGAMRRASALRLHAPATEGLAENLARLSDLWHARSPDTYRPLEISCDGVAPGVTSSKPPILCFSGGLDSAYSLFRHSDERGAGGDVRRLGSAVMVAGLDIPVEETEAFARSFAKARSMAESRGVPLEPASTNLRTIRQGWTHSHTATLAAVMNLFRGLHGLGLMAIGFTVEEARVWWPQDETDPALTSSRAFPVVGDGYEADRFEKFDAIRGWPEAMRGLRVCYRPGSWVDNCGGCLKCATVGFFGRIVLGATPTCLPRAMRDEDVRTFEITPDPNARLRLLQMWKHARARGLREPWIDEVERILVHAGIELPRGGATGPSSGPAARHP